MSGARRAVSIALSPTMLAVAVAWAAGFNRYSQMQRAGLALAAKPSGAVAVIVAFGGGEGRGAASGWVVAFDTARLASGGAPANVWCSNPNNDAGIGFGAGVWMANAAPAVDDNGDIFVVTGNGPYNPRFARDQLGQRRPAHVDSGESGRAHGQ